MKKLTALVLAVVLLSPAAAFAGSSTDAALGLGAFAVFNQILGGVGLFGGFAHPAPVYAAPAAVYAPPPPVVYTPPPVVYYAPPPPVVYAPAPVVFAPPVVVGGPVFVRPFHHHFPRPVVVYRRW
jgi:hypothetical protein